MNTLKFDICQNAITNVTSAKDRHLYHLALAKGISDTLAIPHEEVTGYYAQFELANVVRILDTLNESYVLPINDMLRHVKTFYKFRYDTIHNPLHIDLDAIIAIAGFSPQMKDAAVDGRMNEVSKRLTYAILCD